MSRVGRKIIPIPKDVKVTVGDRAVQIQGPKGKLETPVPPGISFKRKPQSPSTYAPGRGCVGSRVRPCRSVKPRKPRKWFGSRAATSHASTGAPPLQYFTSSPRER